MISTWGLFLESPSLLESLPPSTRDFCRSGAHNLVQNVLFMTLPQFLISAIVAFALPSPQIWARERTFPFTLEITNLRTQEGQLCLAIFRTAEGFPDQADLAVFQDCLPIPSTPPDQLVTFSVDLPYSNYAIAVFHDQNQNDRLDTGGFGIPTEGFGFSNNPRVRFAPPSFMDARVLFTPQLPSTTIHLRYF